MKLSGSAETDIADADRGTARAQLMKELQAKTEKLKFAKLERKGFDGAVGSRLWAWMSGRTDEREAEKVKLNNAVSKAEAELKAVQARLRALDAGEKKAVYGESKKTETKAPEETRDLVQLASKEEIDKASKAMTEAEKKIADAKRDRFEKEIEEIRRENEEYKKQAQFLLENEKKKLALPNGV